MTHLARLGIDFGTSHTVAVLNRGGASVPLLFDSSPILPSAVYAEPEGRLLVGVDAVNAARFEPARCEPNPKRRVDDGRVLLGDKEFSVEELIAAVLARVRLEYERVTGTPTKSVSLTHPATWGSARRLVLEDAAVKAGFHKVGLVPEPVAAARYFRNVLRHELPPSSGVTVADLGGGTFDASVVSGDFEVLSVDGSEQLGGVDIDHALLSLMDERFGGAADWERLVNPRTVTDRRLRRGLYEEVRTAKERLSRNSRVDLPVPVLDADTHITREELEELTRPLLEPMVRITRAVMRASRLPDDKLSAVLLVGGSSRMPLVATMLHQELGRAPIVLEQPELVVAQGATLTGPGTTAPSRPLATPDSDDEHRIERPPNQPAPPIATSPPPAVATPPVESSPEPPRVPPSSPPERPPVLVRIARILLWIHATIGVWWTVVFISVYSDHNPETPGHQTMLVGCATASALALVPMGVAALRFDKRTPGTRAFAFGINVAAALLYTILSLVLIQFQAWLTEPLSVILPVTVSSAILLNTKAAVRWFDPVPQVPRPTPSGAVRLAQTTMWTHVAFGAAATFGSAVDFMYWAEDRSGPVTIMDDAMMALAAFLPVLAVAGYTMLGTAAGWLRSHTSQSRTFSIIANAAVIAAYPLLIIGFFLILDGSDFTDVLPGAIGFAGVFTAMAVVSVIPLLLPSVKQRFTPS